MFFDSNVNLSTAQFLTVILSAIASNKLYEMSKVTTSSHLVSIEQCVIA